MRHRLVWWPRIGPLRQRRNRIDNTFVTTGSYERERENVVGEGTRSGEYEERAGVGRETAAGMPGEESTARATEEYREPEGGGRFYSSRPTVGSGRETTGAYTTTPGMAERPLDERLTKELGVPVERSAGDEYRRDDRPVVVERSSYERLPHEPSGSGMGGGGMGGGLGMRGPPDDRGLREEEGMRSKRDVGGAGADTGRNKVDEGYYEGPLRSMGRRLGMTS